jgi:hypothetical protein
MAVDLSRLDELKMELLYSEKIEDAFTFFFDHFGESPEFIEMGEAVTEVPAKLLAALEAIGQKVFPGQEGVLVDVRLVRLAERQFVHGTGTLGGLLLSVLLFEDTDLGAVALMREPTKVLYSRFTLTPTQTPAAPPPHWFRRQGRN